jgi:hypothetical protein
MSKGRLARIRDMVRSQQYDMSAHAMEEMAEDSLDIDDVEEAILNGRITRIEKDDPRGIKYIVEGTGADWTTPVAVVGRFVSEERYLIVTVYKIEG